MKAIRLGDLAKKLGGDLRGSPEIMIEKVSLLEEAGRGSIVYVSDFKRVEVAENSKASALLVPVGVQDGKKPMIVVRNPKLALARLLGVFNVSQPRKAGIHPTAVVDKTARIESGGWVGPYAVIGAGARIGKRVKVGAFALIDEGVKVGDDTEIHARATVLHHVEVGNQCVLYEGCVIGSQGFGYATDEAGKHVHVPQTGTVILEDGVEIGANTTVDRATLGVTRIGKGTKIDNLVQVAHNCNLGGDCLIAALVGIAGSASIGDGTVIGGFSGIRDHVQIGEKTVIAAATSVWGDVGPGEFVSGTPARPHAEQLRIYALIHKLPELVKRLESLEKRMGG